MALFQERSGEKEGHRRKRFLEYLRSQPMTEPETGKKIPVTWRPSPRGVIYTVSR